MNSRRPIAAGTWRTDPPPVEEMLAEVRVLRFRSSGAKRGTVLHLHGGGFRIGCPEMTGPYAAALAERCTVEIICPAYRLAPDHPFPSGLADARAVMRALVGEGEGPLLLFGDSEGGALAASLTALATSEGVQIPALVMARPDRFGPILRDQRGDGPAVLS